MSKIDTNNSLAVLGAASLCALPPLPYVENALEPVITAETMRFHYEKHHEGYVSNLKLLGNLLTDCSRSISGPVVWQVICL